MKKFQLFCSDLDGTLVGNPESGRRFKETWEALPRSDRPLLCYASGRLVQNIIDLLSLEPLPWPDYIIGGVGTQLYDARRKIAVREFDRRFGKGWDGAKVEEILKHFPGVVRQPEEFLHPYKSSWYLQDASRETIEQVRAAFARAALAVTVIYSNERFLDVLPANTDKGTAIDWLCKKNGIPLEHVLVAGDTANDSSMFLLPGVQGIVVENARPELYKAVVHRPTFNATRVMAHGVLEGLEHFGVCPPPPTFMLATNSSSAATKFPPIDFH